ncbi:MAG: hypothetical protein II939_00760 [Bacteroidales bacterium]|nr:hypothetical protein [Bacteroidales bacterium]
MSSVWKGVKNLGLSWLGGEVVKKGKEFLGNHNTSTTTSDITSSTDVDVDTSDSIFDASDYFRCFLW